MLNLARPNTFFLNRGVIEFLFQIRPPFHIKKTMAAFMWHRAVQKKKRFEIGIRLFCSEHFLKSEIVESDFLFNLIVNFFSYSPNVARRSRTVVEFSGKVKELHPFYRED